MSANTFCDSTGISALVMGSRWARERGGELRIVVPDASVRRIFKATGADRLLRIFGNITEATADQAAP